MLSRRLESGCCVSACDRREPPSQRRQREANRPGSKAGWGAAALGLQGLEVEREGLRGRRERREAVAAAERRKVGPIVGVGAPVAGAWSGVARSCSTARASSARTAPPPSSGSIVAKLLPPAAFPASGLIWEPSGGVSTASSPSGLVVVPVPEKGFFSGTQAT